MTVPGNIYKDSNNNTIVLDLEIEAQTVSKGFFFHPNLVNLSRGMITKKM